MLLEMFQIQLEQIKISQANIARVCAKTASEASRKAAVTHGRKTLKNAELLETYVLNYFFMGLLLIMKTELFLKL